MKKVNLRDLYPDVYKNDYLVEVTEDVLETIRAAERAEAAYDRRMYRYNWTNPVHARSFQIFRSSYLWIF